MVRRKLGTFTVAVAAVAIVLWLPVAPASGQGFGRILATTVNDGEPTDPDGATPVYGDQQIKVGGSYGLADKSSVDESTRPSWFEALLDLLRSLRLLPAEEGKG
jgi:hypothetical protein